MANSQLSQLAAMGTFDGATATQLTPSRGLGAIVRTGGQPAGSYDIKVDRNVAGALALSEAVIEVTALATTPVFALAQCSLVDETTLRVELYDAAAGAFVDAKFCVAVHRVN